MKHGINKFKQWRLKAGLSQRQLADKLGYSTPQFLSNNECGISAPSFNIVKRMSQALGVPASEIADEIERFKRANFEAGIKADRKYLGI